MILDEYLNGIKRKYTNIDEKKYKNYYKKKELMTEYEYIFYKKLKENLKNTNLEIFAQVNLQAIIGIKPYQKGQQADRSRINRKYIDYVITQENKIICCIELDDYTHEKEDRIKRDDFINELFIETNQKIIRIKNIKDVDKISYIIKYEAIRKQKEVD